MIYMIILKAYHVKQMMFWKEWHKATEYNILEENIQVKDIFV